MFYFLNVPAIYLTKPTRKGATMELNVPLYDRCALLAEPKKPRRKRRKKKIVLYTTVAIRNYNHDFKIYRIREIFAEEFVAWFNETRGHCAFLTAYTNTFTLNYHPLPREIIESFRAHQLLSA